MHTKKILFMSLCVVFAAGMAYGDWDSPKWVQLPNETSSGMDVRMDRNDGLVRTLADDFLCTSPDLITDIHFWGSWRGDIKGEITKIHLSIHGDIPVGQSDYSMPGPLLWEQDFLSGQFAERHYRDISPVFEYWYDPFAEAPLLEREGDQHIWQYNILIDPQGAFEQLGTPANPLVYWLDIYVETDGEGEFGWKTSNMHWNDDAVMGVPNPTGGPGTAWSELTYPYTTPSWLGDSVDFAFVITPEPGTVTLLGLGGFAFLRKRRKVFSGSA